MTSVLFFDWLKRFDHHFSETNRKVILLLGNCSAHGPYQTAPELTHVELYYLPPNITSKIQPCDAGIIASLKVRYRNYQMNRALDMAEDKNITNIYKVDVLSAMQTWTRVWNNLQAKIIANCWRHTGIVGIENTNAMATLQNEEAQLTEAIQYLVPNHSGMRITDVFNPTGENDCFRVISDEQLVDDITRSCVQQDADSDDECDEEVPLPPIQAQMKAVALCTRLCDVYNVNETIRGAVSALQKKLRRKRHSMVRQTSMDE